MPIAVTQEGVRTGPRDFILKVANATNADGSRKYHLDISLNTLVTKVRFDQSSSTPRAIGVDYLNGPSLYKADPRASSATGTGTPGSVNASKEVILSAGTFNTPQLLVLPPRFSIGIMRSANFLDQKLSGIGPKAELEKFNIPVLVDLPGVGTNLQDRYETGLVGKSNVDFILTKDCTFMETNPDPCLEQWKKFPESSVLRGVYATNGVAIAIVRKSGAAASRDDPDILVSGAPAYFSGYYPGYSSFGIRDARHWTWIVLKAHSRNNAGTVTLKSADPRDMPVINFNSFDAGVTAGGADELDVQAVREAMQFSRQAFKDLIPLHGDFQEVWPGSNVSTTEEWNDFIKQEAWGHHASCTCPIGADDDLNAVLDSRFRVRGVDSLRVVDASVFPKIPGFVSFVTSLGNGLEI